MKILIAGDGKVGSTLARQLSLEGEDITLIDSNAKVLDLSVERYDVMAVHGNCVSKAVQLQAGVKNADLLIAATSADEINLLCCMTAHNLNPILHTIARIRNPEYTDQIYEMRDIFALSMVVNPEKQAALEIERLLRYPGFLKRDTFAKGRVEIVELMVDEESKLQNIALSDLDGIVKCQVLVCAVQRKGQVIAPDGNFILQRGDRIFVTAPVNNLSKLLKNLGIITHRAKRVILCGGGRVSVYLAQRLQRSGINIQLIEQDKERCEVLAELLPAVDVIHGDGSSQYLLESEGIADCDALVTMTGLDELNMIISLYGKSCGVPQVITKVGHMENSDIRDSLSLGSIVCPKELCTESIVRFVRGMKEQNGAALSVHWIVEGKLEAIEFEVDHTTKNCGIPLRDIELKPNVLVTCITHGPLTEIPNGNSSFRRGDTVIIVSSGDEVIYQLNDIFA